MCVWVHLTYVGLLQPSLKRWCLKTRGHSENERDGKRLKTVRQQSWTRLLFISCTPWMSSSCSNCKIRLCIVWEYSINPRITVTISKTSSQSSDISQKNHRIGVLLSMMSASNYFQKNVLFAEIAFNYVSVNWHISSGSVKKCGWSYFSGLQPINNSHLHLGLKSNNHFRQI